MPQTTIIELGGRRYRVTCLPDPEPIEKLNAVETYISITECLKKALLKDTLTTYNQADISAWLSKFPKPIK
jgi:hypothetical protein